MRLIDADALCETLGIAEPCKDCDHYRGWSCTDPIWTDVCDAILDAPTVGAQAVDAVPVVRCKDCKYFHGEYTHCGFNIVPPVDYFFCMNGQRKAEP